MQLWLHLVWTMETLFFMVSTTMCFRNFKGSRTLRRDLSPAKKRKYDHITPELMALHWLPIKYRCQYKLLLYTFKVLTESAPVYLQELLTIHVPTRSLHSENSMLLSKPRVRTKTFGERQFDRAASTLWNNLPSSIRHEQSMGIVKKQLNTYLFRLVYVDCI